MFLLFKHELRKITQKKSVTIAFICLLLCISLLCTLFASENFRTDETGTRLSGPAAISLHKKQAEEQKGYLSAERLSSVLAHYHEILNNPDNYISLGAEGDSISDEVYGSEIQQYDEILDLMRRAFSPTGTYDYYILSSVNPGDMTRFYDTRTAKVEEILNLDYSTGNYTPAEKEYFKQLNSKIQTPFYYTYTKGWYDMLTRGFLTILLMVSFIVCICIAPVFANEYQTGADSIILSSKYGKNRVISAKILSSIVFTTIIYAVAMLLFTAFTLLFHGTSGWNAPFQLISFNSPYPLTIGQVYLLGLAIAYVVVISIMSITLLFSALMKTSFSVIIIGALYIFVPMFLPSGKAASFINDTLALLPAKAMDIFSVFSVYGAYNMFGNITPLPVMIVIFSACITALALPLAYLGFKKHQVA